MKKKNAFTLAEILITLGVIGIVAAMTLPALIQKQQKKEISVSLKKLYSAMSQAILMSQTVNGDIENWSRSGNLTDDNPDVQNNKNYEEIKHYWDKYYAPFIKTVRTEKSTEEGLGRLKVYLPDGSSMLVWNGGCMSFLYDANGDKKPNKSGQDIFNFHVCEEVNERNLYLGNRKYFGPAGMIDAVNRDKAIEICQNEGYNCGALLIMYDNFEFKRDYPWW